MTENDQIKISTVILTKAFYLHEFIKISNVTDENKKKASLIFSGITGMKDDIMRLSAVCEEDKLTELNTVLMMVEMAIETLLKIAATDGPTEL